MFAQKVDTIIKNKKALLNFVLIAILMMIGLFVIISVSLTSIVELNKQPSYALEANSVTSLATGVGLVEGENLLRLSTIQTQTLDGDEASQGSQASQTISVNHNNLPDIFLSGSLHTNRGVSKEWWEDLFGPSWSAGHSDDALIRNSGSGVYKELEIRTYPRGGTSNIVISSRIKVSPLLRDYIRDPMLSVKANVKFDTKIVIDNDFDMDVALKWSPTPATEISDSVTIRGESVSFLRTPIMLDEINDEAYLEMRITNMHHGRSMDGQSHKQSDFDYTKSGIGVLFKGISIEISIEHNAGLICRQAQPNFADITIIGEDRDERCSGDFVKEGDIIYISTNFQTMDATYYLSYDAATNKHSVTYQGNYDVEPLTVISKYRDHVFNCQDPDMYSTIEWDYNKNCLQRIVDDDEYDITGQTAKFLVKILEPSMITPLRFAPYLRSIDEDDQFKALTSINNIFVTLRGDAAAPYEPMIDEDDPFFLDNFMNKEWYTRNFINTPEKRGVEVTLDMNRISFNEAGGSKIKIFYTTDNSDPITSSTRLTLLENPIDSTTNPRVKLFFEMPGETTLKIFTLKFVSYDFVGNIGESVIIYDELKFDCTDYAINIFFTQGDRVGNTLANLPAVSHFGYAQLGRHASESNRDYSNVRDVATRTYRRGDLIYIRLTLKKNSNYRLIQYFNSGLRNVAAESVNYGDFALGDYGDFIEKSRLEVYLYVPGGYQEIGIVLTDEMLEDENSLNFYFYFKERLNILVGATEAIYDGTPKGIEQPTTNITGIDITTYYKQNIEEEFTSTGRFANAGTYYYKCEVVDTNYFGFAEGAFIIHKANPFITELQVLDIVYGNSMANAIIRCKNTDPDFNVGYNSGHSSDRKVMGDFSIIYPDADSIAYKSPTQGLKDIRVLFHPSSQYIMNYNDIEFQTTLYVDYSTMLEMQFETASLTYTFSRDTKRMARVITVPANQMLIYEYKRENQPDSAYSINEPIDAGIYEVRVRTDLALCNYDKMITTEGTTLKFVINRQALYVEAEPTEAFYQNDFDPIALAYNNRTDKIFVPITDWRYEYRVEGEWVEQRPSNAGSYEAKVIINSLDKFGVIIGNYVGEAITTLTIKKGNADANTTFSIVYPQALTDPSIKAHISYGQTLGDISLTAGSGYVAKYMFRNIDNKGVIYYENRIVPGQFVVTSRLYNPQLDANSLAFAEEMRTKVMPVGRYVSNSALYMTFIPEDVLNFNVASIRANITIIEGTPTFTNIIVEDLTYGDISSDVVLTGYNKGEEVKPIFNISEIVNIDGHIVNPFVNGMPITGKLIFIDNENRILTAGTQLIAFSFVPDDEINIKKVLSFTIPIRVNKDMLLLEAQEREELEEGELITRLYGSQFYDPQINIYKVIEGIKFIDNNFNINYMYYNANDEIVAMNASSRAGQYKLVATIINNNYQGELVEYIQIAKATPIMHTPPNTGTVRYGMDMSGVILSNGRMQHPVTFYAVAGMFEFDGAPQSPTSVGEIEYDAIFFPNDTVNYNKVYLTIRIRVQKAIASIELDNLVHTYSGVRQEPVYSTNIVIRIDGSEEYYVNLDEGDNQFTQFDRFLSLDIRYSTVDGQTPVNAGTYIVTARINDSCYEGVLEKAYVIHQAEARVIVQEESMAQQYNGGIISLRAYAEDMQGNGIDVNIVQSFMNYSGATLADIPRNVGTYTVTLDIRDINYRGTAISHLTITIAQLMVQNSVQSYGTRLPIVVEQLPMIAQSRVSYRRLLENGQYDDATERQPTNAGTYKIIIEFEAQLNGGYSAVFEDTLFIKKGQVELSYNREFRYSYMSEKNTALVADIKNIRVSPNPLYTLDRYVEFYDAQADVFTAEEPFDVGVYTMKVIIDDINYEGEGEFEYIIAKANPTIRINPIVSPIIYTDDGTQVVIEGGEVIFNGTIKFGSYHLVENTMSFEVGLHNVRYCFTPDDNHNLNEVYGITQISVQQKDISQLIIFSGDDVVEYNTLAHTILASISTGQRVVIDVFYNRSKSAPRERGEYTVTAEIIDKNYKGQAEWDKKLVIRVGEPLIVSPRLSNINIGSPLSYSQIMGGYAYIKGTGEFIDGQLVDGTATVIPGVFAFINAAQVMQEANERTVQLSFKPFSSNNFSNIIFNTKIKVIGTNPIIGEVAAAPKEQGQLVYYGQPLSNFNIFFTTTPENATEGILSFVDQTVIPEVGKSVTYRFHPTNDKEYNIIEGQVAVNINKTTADILQVRANAFYGQSLRQMIFDAVMVNAYNSQVEVDGMFELLSAQGFNNLDTILTVQNVADMTQVIDDVRTTFGRYRFVSDNYVTAEGDVEIRFYQLVNDTNINVQKLSKYYNALPIDVSELEIDVSSTQHPLLAENFNIFIYDNRGNISQGIEVGVYTIMLEITDTIYYGIKTIEFEVKRTDISEYLSLSHFSAEFGGVIVKPTAEILSDRFGEIPQQNFIIEFKLITERPNAYNQTMPSRAGIYDVRITISDNKYLSGQKNLLFTIEKKMVNVVANNAIHNFGNVSPLVVEVVDSSLIPKITYYSPTYNRSTVVPTEAGVYTARVEIIDDDYTIRNGSLYYIEVSFRILQAQLTLREKPYLSDIVYGQKLKDSTIMGGRVTYGSDISILGRYEFVAPEHKPSAMTQPINLLFIPYNSNYATLQINDVNINVLRANVEIIFTELTAIYDGKNKRDVVRYVSSADVEWQVQFVQNGIATEPINAGIYQIKVKVLSPDYQLGTDIYGTPVLEKSSVATFIIEKASMESFSPPVSTPIIYGQSLAYSTLNISRHISEREEDNFGLVTYYDIDGYIKGDFAYINEGVVLGDAGEYIVDIIFLPQDAINYNSFNTKIKVEVLAAPASITVTNNYYTYGTPITLPTFRTNPGNLTVEHNMDILGEIVDCGTYTYRAWVTSKNYDAPENYFEFNIVIQKKEVRISFVQDEQHTDKYFTTYGKLLYAQGVVNPEDMAIPETRINQHIDLNYYSIPKNDRESSIDYGLSLPAKIGDYRVVAVMNHPNYYGTAQIYYDIGLGEVEEIYFDNHTLEKQIYGSTIVPPVITTKPANVAYWIDYQGSGKIMPQKAGTYNIVVYFNDPNFAPRHITAMFKIQRRELTVEKIEVEDKVYDGIPTLTISGRLKGVTLNDEVYLTLEARTSQGKINTGTHKVEIVRYEISGSRAENYYLTRPYYNESVRIYKKKVTDENQQSYITTNKGFSDGVTVEFKEIISDKNRENALSNLFGINASVITFVIRENGYSTTLDERIKVYIKIPDEYINVKNLSYEGIGNLANQQLRREGDYLTFYTDTSGEVVFHSNDFSYWTIGAIAALVAIIVGIILLIWLNPKHRRKRTSDDTIMNETIARVKKGYYKKRKIYK